jgi:hypothetical protein
LRHVDQGAAGAAWAGEKESIALVAREAARRLEIVTDESRGLFRACVLEI